eukprot:Hpha_TRINITY_DN31121_c0_g1::TRINITY_DN31121_c0_g1_i1::g.32943::m.32943
MAGMTPEEVAHFRRHGYVVVRGVLGDDELRPVEADLTRMVDEKARELLAAGQIKSLYRSLPFPRRLAAIVGDCSDEVLQKDISSWGQKLDTMNALLPGVFQVFFAPRFVACAASLLGEEVTLNPIQHLRPFLPARRGEHLISGAASLAPWHQDQGVTLAEADQSDIITCFTALADIPAEAGCLEVIPDVPYRELLPHVKDPVYGTTIDPKRLPTQSPVRCPLRRGDVLFMSAYTPHRTSGPNLTSNVRWSLDIRFQKTGQPTGRPFWPSFVVRSPSSPGSEQRSFVEWQNRWIHDLANSKGKQWHRVAGDVGGSVGARASGRQGDYNAKL